MTVVDIDSDVVDRAERIQEVSLSFAAESNEVRSLSRGLLGPDSSSWLGLGKPGSRDVGDRGRAQNAIVRRVLSEAVEAVSMDQVRLVAEFVERGSGVTDKFGVEFDAGYVARAAAVADFGSPS
jgi:hypothetical protein